MSTILYYSNYCNSSKQVLQILSKFDMSNEIHFVCIDNRVNKDGKKFAILGNNQEIVIPDNIKVVPALLVLTQQYNVIYVNEIINYFKSNMNQQVNHATKNNKIPVSLETNEISEFGGFGGGIVSDHYSFLDQDSGDLGVKGDGGLRQIHNYVRLNDDNLVSKPAQKGQTQQQQQQQQQQSDTKNNKIKEGEYTLEQLVQSREQDLRMYGPKMSYNTR